MPLFFILCFTCLLLLIISMDVELNPGPCDKACRTYIDRHQLSTETKIQQLFNCIRQQSDALNTKIGHRFEQLHQVLEHMVHDIQQLKKQYQDNRANIDQLLEGQNSTHLCLTKLEEAMEKSERQIRERNLKIFGICEARDGERTTYAEELVKTINCSSVQLVWELSDIESTHRIGRIRGYNRPSHSTVPVSTTSCP